MLIVNILVLLLILGGYFYLTHLVWCWLLICFCHIQLRSSSTCFFSGFLLQRGGVFCHKYFLRLFIWSFVVLLYFCLYDVLHLLTYVCWTTFSSLGWSLLWLWCMIFFLMCRNLLLNILLRILCSLKELAYSFLICWVFVQF